MKRFKKGFTLAEVLITLAIIGVVAAISIPSVISNSQQQEFKTGLRKAVSVLNSAITMNMALDGESPYDIVGDDNIFKYLQRHMAVIKSTTNLRTLFYATTGTDSGRTVVQNAAFYTTDGMRFEFIHYWYSIGSGIRLHESGMRPNLIYMPEYEGAEYMEGVSQQQKCGSFGLGDKTNSNNTTSLPCYITVDVNGDRKPNPANVNCKASSCAKPYKYSDTNGLKLTDVFPILITDKQAIPYGVAAQRAMYQAQATK